MAPARARLRRHRGTRSRVADAVLRGRRRPRARGTGRRLAGPLTWRNDDKAQRVVLQPGPANDAVYVGFEAAGEIAFDAVAARLEPAGYAVEDADAELNAERRVDRLASTTAPWGVAVEVVGDLRRRRRPYASPLMPGGFLTDGVGLRPRVFATMAFEESAPLPHRGTGARAVRLARESRSPRASSSRCASTTATSGTTRGAGQGALRAAQKLHHVMFEANSADDVGAAFDRAWNSDLAIPNGLGRHDNDRCSASTWPARPASWSRSATEQARHREMGRQPALRPHQHLGSPAAPRPPHENRQQQRPCRGRLRGRDRRHGRRKRAAGSVRTPWHIYDDWVRTSRGRRRGHHPGALP